MRVLTVDEMRPAVRGLAGRKQERVAALPHKGIGREHGTKAERAVAKRTLRHSHPHSIEECLLTTARSALAVVNAIEERMPHGHPVAVLAVDSFVRCRIRQPACARAFSTDAVWPAKC